MKRIIAQLGQVGPPRPDDVQPERGRLPTALAPQVKFVLPRSVGALQVRLRHLLGKALTLVGACQAQGQTFGLVELELRLQRLVPSSC